MTHSRWFCYQCKREWVYAHGWNVADGCPICRGAKIELITYESTFPGGDIPRTSADNIL